MEEESAYYKQTMQLQEILQDTIFKACKAGFSAQVVADTFLRYAIGIMQKEFKGKGTWQEYARWLTDKAIQIFEDLDKKEKEYWNGCN